MSEKKIKYTVSIYTENSVGLLNRISAIFQKRHINIESFNSSITEIEDVHRWTILVHTSETLIKKIVGQINKQIEVIKSYYHTDEETIYQESCLFKIKSSLLFDDRKIQNIIKETLNKASKEVDTMSAEKMSVLTKQGMPTDLPF